MNIQEARRQYEADVVADENVTNYRLAGSSQIEGIDVTTIGDIDVLVVTNLEQWTAEEKFFGKGYYKTQSFYPGDFWISMRKGDLNLLICKDEAVFLLACTTQQEVEALRMYDKAERKAYWRKAFNESGT